jgi:hypothetical protein
VAWRRERAPLWPLDFDPRFCQVAPSDQQVPGFLHGGETCRLLNLTPEGSTTFVLPKLCIGCSSHSDVKFPIFS